MTSTTRRTMIVALPVALLGCQPVPPPSAEAIADAERLQKRAAADAARSQAFFSASFKDFERRMQPLAQYQGKTVVAYFWATWCKPCVAEVPMLKDLQARWRGRGVVLVGIAIDNADKVQAFVREHGIEYPVLIGGNDAYELSMTLGNLVKAVPFFALFDRNGRFSTRFVGEVKGEDLERALAAAAGAAS